jgi:protein SCO1
MPMRSAIALITLLTLSCGPGARSRGGGETPMRSAIALITLLTLSCGRGAEVSTGRELYLAYGCAACHGERGDGQGPAAALAHTKPRDLRDLDATVEGIAGTILFGVADGRTGMPAYPDIPKRERIAIAEYIHELARAPRGITVSDGWARASNAVWQITSAYVTIANGTANEVALIGATSPAAKTVEIHEMAMTGESMSMRKVDQIAIPPRGTAQLQPGGSHLMLIDLTRDLRAGETVELTLRFDDGTIKTIDAHVRSEEASMPSTSAPNPLPAADRRLPTQFALVDHDGRPFRSTSLRGKGALLFFGYTHCPDACPMTMAKIARAYREAGAAARDIPTLFVSVDPRDTPAVLKQYLTYFGAVPAIGLTGSKAQIDDVVQQLGARYEIRDSGSAAGPLVDHTLSIYLIDRDGRVRKKFAPSDDPAAVAAAMLAP